MDKITLEKARNDITGIDSLANEVIGAWHGGTMNDVRASISDLEEALKEKGKLIYQ